MAVTSQALAKAGMKEERPRHSWTRYRRPFRLATTGGWEGCCSLLARCLSESTRPKRRAANVAKADEEDSELSGHVFPRLSVPANLGISVRGLPPPLRKRDLRTCGRGKLVRERRAESLTYDDR
jgi:hypothetical protein